MGPKRYSYNWLHIPTGTAGTSESDKKYCSREDFLDDLGNWNRLGRNWKYWVS